GYQGNFPKFEVFRAQLPPGLFTTDGVEFFGEFNFLKSGIMFADALTTVSRTYSREILMPEHGFRLETVLKRRQGDLHGIVNGIDTWEWNADRDPWIPQHFNAGSLEGKQACKRDLLDHFSLDLDMKTPLFGLVTRLAWQKGMDLLMQAWPSLVRDGTGVVVLGQGEPHYEAFLKEQAGSQTGVHLGFDEGLAHRILAGCDFLLMPSVYEPCGLTQMQAMRYGTVPIVHAVGGLKDTVPQFNPRTRKGLGFKFTPFGLESFQASLKNALRVYHTPPAWAHLIHNCLTADFSWDHAARRYEKVYSNTLHRDR
ncbi:MAG: glycogen synthase, partial [Nitrospinaceae bacterium]